MCCFRFLEEHCGAIVITPTTDWFYLIIFLRSKIWKEFVKVIYLEAGSEENTLVLKLNYRIYYERMSFTLHSTLFTTILSKQ